MSKSLERQTRGINMPNVLRDKERQLTKMMAIIFFTFLMAYIPSFVVKLVKNSCYFLSIIKDNQL